MLNSAATAVGATIERAAGPPPAPAMSLRGEAPPVPGPDAESRAWLLGLRAEGARREEASSRLHDLLLRAARFEISRRRGSHPHLRGGDLDDLAHQAANDALFAILGKLDSYRGDSRFTTWAYKFALLEAAVKLRRRAWQGREVPIEPEHWSVLAGRGDSPAAEAESNELLGSIGAAIESELSPHQREVLVAIALNDVPIDVLGERFNTTRGALYKTIHDARKKLRSHLAEAGLRFEVDELEQTGPRP
jgi:RNA polymerase sigma-70 factor (ECF subfamily)